MLQEPLSGLIRDSHCWDISAHAERAVSNSTASIKSNSRSRRREPARRKTGTKPHVENLRPFWLPGPVERAHWKERGVPWVSVVQALTAADWGSVLNPF